MPAPNVLAVAAVPPPLLRAATPRTMGGAVPDLLTTADRPRTTSLGAPTTTARGAEAAVVAVDVDCSLEPNPIVCENGKPGSPPSEWDLPGGKLDGLDATPGAGDPSIQGFATDISVAPGQPVAFKINTPASSYRIDIYRLGFYDFDGARKIASILPSATLPQVQPACMVDSARGLVDCGNWGVSASWTVPASAVSGVYLAKLVRTDGPTGASHIVFIVRDDTGRSDLLFQTSDTTWQAYNDYGGASLYKSTLSPIGRAYAVSY
ncbi:MAG TPA: N,N-dimethylformamidase beta subunit family domain-containing protein, partial [Vicinamibacterales bacterium]|nr:N,N-dimethylformamidase beta subunit family domain-containing protein [Vicinamibacterales bacterium]